MNESSSDVFIAGTVVNKRRVSKKLVRSHCLNHEFIESCVGPISNLDNCWWLQVFFDLESEVGTITELCCKAGLQYTVEQVKDLRDSIKVGDSISVIGCDETGDPHVVLPSSITVTARWKDQHSGQHFVPRCTPKPVQQLDNSTSKGRGQEISQSRQVAEESSQERCKVAADLEAPASPQPSQVTDEL